MPKSKIDNPDNPKVLLKLFASVAEYNCAGPRYPLPDLHSQQPWEDRYTGFDAPTLLPESLTESHAKDFVCGLAAFSGHLERSTQDRQGAYRQILSALYGSHSHYDQIARDTVRNILEFRTVGNLRTLTGNLSDYVTAVKNRSPQEKGLKHLLGVSVKRATAGQLAKAIEILQGANFLGYLMDYSSRTKPQYTQPMMFFMGDAIERSQNLIPALHDQFEELKTAYRSSNLGRAVTGLRALIL
ncbi:MAG: hypothetical protein PHY92_06365 [Alphaproteobacteria bacterium]|nr:hypothetical protein [Alphaproteobacteria bacterium]